MAKNSILFYIVVITVTVTATENTTLYKNGLGWDNGLSYRRRLSENYTLTVRLSGDASYEISNGDVIRKDVNVPENTTENSTKVIADSSLQYSVGVTLGLSKKLIRERIFSLDGFLRGGYEHNWRDRKSKEGDRNNMWTGYTVHSIIGFEPAVWVMNRMSISTRFGLQYEYQYNLLNDNHKYKSGSGVHWTSSEVDRKSHKVRLVGLPFSLFMVFGVHFYF